MGALISSTGPRKKTTYSTGNNNTAGVEKLWSVPTNSIIAGNHQPRKSFAEPELQELASSIKEHGILQPLLVVEKDDGGYELISGERRLRAARIAGLPAVPVIVKQLANHQRLEVALIENVQREDLNPVEEAYAYKRLIEEFGLTQEQVAKKVGKSRPAIANSVRLLELPAKVLAALGEKKITAGQARALLSVKDEKQQLDLLNSMLGQKITVRELEREGRRQSPNAGKRDPNLLYLEDQLRAALNTKVTINKQGKRGTVIISFYSPEELNKIIKIITGK